MEALRTKLDNLQWEVNRLDAENQRLRADNDSVCQQIDLEQRVQQLTEELLTCQQQLQESEQRAELVAHQQAALLAGGETERLKELEEGLLTAEAKVSALELRGHSLEEELEQQCRTIDSLRMELAERDKKSQEMEAARCAAIESSEKDAQLYLYQKLEEERQKWEVREKQLVQQLEYVRTTSFRPSLLQGECQQLQHELAVTRSKVTQLEGVVASKEQLLNQQA